MALQITGTMGANREVSNIIVNIGVAVEVTANEIALYALDTVALYRQLEITNGWVALINFVRDRALLDRFNTQSPPGFLTARLYSAQDIDSMGEGGDRRTASDIAFFTPNDIAIGVGEGITGVPAAGLVTPILTGFTKMIQASREQTLTTA